MKKLKSYQNDLLSNNNINIDSMEYMDNAIKDSEMDLIKIHDPELYDIIQAIKIRIQVEITKLKY